MSGVVVWFSGLPSSGKSTLAGRVAAYLARAGRPAAILDGDEVREALVPPPGYSAPERASFYATLGRLAALLARQGLVVLVPATAHRRAYRDWARRLAPRFIEVFLDVGIDECRRRDAKGLYARARAELLGLPGEGVEYEVPIEPEVVAHGGEDEAAAGQIFSRLGN